MEGVRPPDQPPPPSRDREDGPIRPSPSRQQRDFQLPNSRKEKESVLKKKEKEGEPRKKEKEGEVKKKNLFDLISGEGQIKEMKQEVGNGKIEETKGIEKTEGAQAKTQVSEIGQVIQNMVDRLHIGSVGGKDFASIDLSKEANVPTAFSGSNLTLSYEAGSLTIRFDNFETPQQEHNALLLVEKNKEQLEKMIRNLQAKNIQVTQLNIGERPVVLPRVEALPPPFQATPPEMEGRPPEREGREGKGEEEKER